MSSLPPAIYADLIGKPFRDGGRGPVEYDCWGLLQIVQRRLGHTPTDFPSSPALLHAAIADEWEPVDPSHLQPGDGILLRSVDPAYVWHVGVVVDPIRFLHTREGANACTERFDVAPHCRLVRGFYRFRGRAA